MAYEVFSSETESLIQQVESLRAEYQRIKSLNNKVIIFTEGKTDVKYLKLALSFMILSMQKIQEMEN